MVKYTRTDITALSNRLERRASVMTPPSAGRDLMAAALLLRLLMQLSDVVEVETTALEVQ